MPRYNLEVGIECVQHTLRLDDPLANVTFTAKVVEPRGDHWYSAITQHGLDCQECTKGRRGVLERWVGTRTALAAADTTT